jgi:hypothetical protein
MDPIIPDDEARHIEPIEEVVAPDDDERQYPEFVDKWDMLEFEDYDEDIVTGAQFEETDEEEEEENIAMGVDEQGEGDDVPRIDYDRDNPSLKGLTFASMTEFRNALATYCIKGEYDYVIYKSEPTRMTVHCAFEVSVEDTCFLYA